MERVDTWEKMPLDARKFVIIVEAILIPIKRIISRILPDYIEENLDDPKTREIIVGAVDVILCNEFPVARLISDDFRKSTIHKLLEMMLDEMLLPEQPE